MGFRKFDTPYLRKLRDPRWQYKRDHILIRDHFRCQLCFWPSNNLRVHHLEYLPGVEPWDHPDELLITYCEDCHTSEHSFELWHRYKRLKLEFTQRATDTADYEDWIKRICEFIAI